LPGPGGHQHETTYFGTLSTTFFPREIRWESSQDSRCNYSTAHPFILEWAAVPATAAAAAALLPKWRRRRRSRRSLSGGGCRGELGGGTDSGSEAAPPLRLQKRQPGTGRRRRRWRRTRRGEAAASGCCCFCGGGGSGSARADHGRPGTRTLRDAAAGPGGLRGAGPRAAALRLGVAGPGGPVPGPGPGRERGGAERRGDGAGPVRRGRRSWVGRRGL
jgi:hypothetical protein